MRRGSRSLRVSCDALNRNLDSMGADEKRELARQAREAQADMSVLKRVLEATRANRNVMRRLREMRERRLEYNERLIRADEHCRGRRRRSLGVACGSCYGG